MSVSINEATGEVTLEVAGKTFRLHGTMERMADLERRSVPPACRRSAVRWRSRARRRR